MADEWADTGLAERHAVGEFVGQIEVDAEFERLVASLVQDAGRAAQSVTTAARPRTVHVRYLSPPSCARCGSLEVVDELLPSRGTLWTFTTQEFLPKEPYAGGETLETFRPYGVGLVQLDDVVRVESRLTEADPEKLRIGMEMELRIVPFRTDADGTEVMTFAFAPVEEG